MYELDGRLEMSANERAELICSLMRVKADLSVGAAHCRRIGALSFERKLLSFRDDISRDVDVMLEQKSSDSDDLFAGTKWQDMSGDIS